MVVERLEEGMEEREGVVGGVEVRGREVGVDPVLSHGLGGEGRIKHTKTGRDCQVEQCNSQRHMGPSLFPTLIIKCPCAAVFAWFTDRSALFWCEHRRTPGQFASCMEIVNAV